MTLTVCRWSIVDPVSRTTGTVPFGDHSFHANSIKIYVLTSARNYLVLTCFCANCQGQNGPSMDNNVYCGRQRTTQMFCFRLSTFDFRFIFTFIFVLRGLLAPMSGLFIPSLPLVTITFFVRWRGGHVV